MSIPEPMALLHLLQLANSALPVGAFSYSEGLETVVQQSVMTNVEQLQHWLVQELHYGTMRIDGWVIRQVYDAIEQGNFRQLASWNHWLSAVRETEEMRLQSWQMGRSLAKLLPELNPDVAPLLQTCGDRCNFAIAFAIAAKQWNIGLEPAVLAYFHSWAANLINAGVKLIPLGQTQGQRLLTGLHADIEMATAAVLNYAEPQIYGCSWGLAIASMNHETLYSRLFRS